MMTGSLRELGDPQKPITLFSGGGPIYLFGDQIVLLITSVIVCQPMKIPLFVVLGGCGAVQAYQMPSRPFWGLPRDARLKEG